MALSTLALAAKGGIERVYHKMTNRDGNIQKLLTESKRDFNYMNGLMYSITNGFDYIYDVSSQDLNNKSSNVTLFDKDDNYIQEILSKPIKSTDQKKIPISWSQKTYTIDIDETSMDHLLGNGIIKNFCLLCIPSKDHKIDVNDLSKQLTAIESNLGSIMSIWHSQESIRKLGKEKGLLLMQFASGAREGVGNARDGFAPSKAFLEKMMVLRGIIGKEFRNQIAQLEKQETQG